MPKRYDNNCVLVFGDTHFPYEHKGMWAFLEYLKSEYPIDRVVHMGDIMDMYSVSAYPKDPDHKDSWSDELKKGRKKVKRLVELFPDMCVLESNHDDRAYKKSRISGLPRSFLIEYREVIGAPPGWKWYPELNIRAESNKTHMFFAHTKAGGALSTAQDKGMSAFLGHHHSRFGMSGFKANKKTIYGVDVGCLVSDKGSPFKYNKMDRGRPIQGACVVVDGMPIMELL
jgi:hypothetical protein